MSCNCKKANDINELKNVLTDNISKINIPFLLKLLILYKYVKYKIIMLFISVANFLIYGKKL